MFFVVVTSSATGPETRPVHCEEPGTMAARREWLVSARTEMIKTKVDLSESYDRDESEHHVPIFYISQHFFCLFVVIFILG